MHLIEEEFLFGGGAEVGMSRKRPYLRKEGCHLFNDL